MDRSIKYQIQAQTICNKLNEEKGFDLKAKVYHTFFNDKHEPFYRAFLNIENIPWDSVTLENDTELIVSPVGDGDTIDEAYDKLESSLVAYFAILQDAFEDIDDPN